VQVTATGLSRTEDDVAVLQPLKNGSVTIKVQDALTKAPAVGALVTVFMTDQAILDLLPYPLQVCVSRLQQCVFASRGTHIILLLFRISLSS
jgi:hypothetical protein